MDERDPVERRCMWGCRAFRPSWWAYEAQEKEKSGGEEEEKRTLRMSGWGSGSGEEEQGA
jgi:hypothetical protein